MVVNKISIINVISIKRKKRNKVEIMMAMKIMIEEIKKIIPVEIIKYKWVKNKKIKKNINANIFEKTWLNNIMKNWQMNFLQLIISLMDFGLKDTGKN